MTQQPDRTVRAEDVLLLTLSTLTGPLLWWLGTMLRAGTPISPVDQVELVIAALCVVLGLFICAAWFVMITAAAVVLAGHATRNHQLSRYGWHLSPRFMKRLLVGVLGTQLLVAPVVHAAEQPVDRLSPAWTAAQSSDPSVQTVSAVGSVPGWMPPTPEPATPESAERTAVDDGRHTHIVTRGDSLWSIAARELGSDATELEVDRRWRQWWDHNRTVIGDNPHVLRPGDVLSTPPWTG